MFAGWKSEDGGRECQSVGQVPGLDATTGKQSPDAGDASWKRWIGQEMHDITKQSASAVWGGLALTSPIPFGSGPSPASKQLDPSASLTTWALAGRWTRFWPRSAGEWTQRVGSCLEAVCCCFLT